MLEHNLDVHAKDKLGGTALHSAAYSGHVNCVKLLIQFGACVDALDMLQHTPIFRACEMGHTEVVNNLILRKFSFDRIISCPFITVLFPWRKSKIVLQYLSLIPETLYVFIYSGPLIAPFSILDRPRFFRSMILFIKPVAFALSTYLIASGQKSLISWVSLFPILIPKKALTDFPVRSYLNLKII